MGRLSGIYDNRKTQQRERWVRGVCLHRTPRIQIDQFKGHRGAAMLQETGAGCLDQGFFSSWESYPDIPRQEK